MKRRLAAILVADVVGYARMMEENADATLAALRQIRLETFEPAVADHQGAVVKGTGDGWLVEFGSATDAATCALTIQERMSGQQALRLRIGVHVGDITHLDGDLFGDGVNIAARLEALAPPGGVAISDMVRSALDTRLRRPFADIGAQTLKNISEPVRVWTSRPGGGPLPASPRTPTMSLGPSAERASVAVLPFQSVSSEPQDGDFTEGLAEDIATELARYRWLRVIGSPTPRAEPSVSEDLRRNTSASGARYTVDGAVRGIGPRLRVTANLNLVADGQRIWAERWDRDRSDLIATQEELSDLIVTRVASEIDAHEQKLARSRPVESLNALEMVHRASLLIVDMRPESLAAADTLLRSAAEKDPTEVRVHSYMAVVCRLRAMSGSWPPQEAALEGVASARRAIALDPRSARSFSALGANFAVLGEADRAIEAAERSYALNPKGWGSRLCRGLAHALAPAGWPADAATIVANAREARRLEPDTPRLAEFMTLEGVGLLLQVEAGSGSWKDAAASLDRAASEQGATWWPSLFAAVGELRRGRIDAASKRCAGALHTYPGLTLGRVQAIFGSTHVGAVWRAEFERLPEIGLPKD